MVEEVTSLKKDFKQKENKFLEEFLDMKALKEKVEDKLYKQDQSLQTVHMLCKPKPYYDEQRKVAIGNKNPLCLTRAKQVQPALYNGHEIIKTNHVPAIVHNSEDTLEIAEITRKKMNEKMKDLECVKKKVKIAPYDYSKENYLVTFTPQTQLTPEQIFWSNDLIKMKAEALKGQTTTSRPIKALTVYPPNTPTTLVPRVLPKKNVFYIATNSELTTSRFTEMHDAHTVVQARCLELEAELSKLALDFQITQLTDNVTVLQEQNELFRTENAKIKQHYKELYDSIKIMRAKHIKQITALLTENENLKSQIHENLKCITIDSVKPIPPHNRNNREVHLDYLKHLKESVETHCEIVEEAKVDRPLDSSLAFAFLYNKHTQELLEYVISTYPKDFNQQDKNHAATPLTRKKQVTFEDQCETSNSNTHKHVEQLYIKKTNVSMPPSTGVNSCTDASGSQPRSNTKKNKILPAKSVNKKQVEEHPRTNKSNLKTTHRVDSNISSKRTVIQIILWYLDSGCSKHMTGDRSRLRNFIKKFIETVRFRNDHFGAIMGYGDYVIGDSVISRHSCFVRDTDGVELIKGSRGSNLYTISVEDMMKSSRICLLSKASKNKSWLWHQRLNHLNFSTINDLENDIVERRNRTLVEAARSMLIFSKAPMFLWAEAVATSCYTQNRSLIHTRHNKTPYELVHDKKPDLTFFRVFGALCYLTNDNEDLGKLQPTADIRIFVGY
ncbi:integrase, catalytic region, zinc finger, CCHC-type containing protein [Tanacetum coccineum]